MIFVLLWATLAAYSIASLVIVLVAEVRGLWGPLPDDPEVADRLWRGWIGTGNWLGR
jgi:hypothetical protein